MPFDFTDRRIAVIGDVILDSYITGSVSRISPEAPVPVVHFKDERLSPGGAANVAANVASLGGSVRLVGLIGTDATSGQLIDLLAGIGSIETHSLVRSSSRPTTLKTRIIGERQQIVRIDREESAEIDSDLVAALHDQGLAAIEWSDVVVLSDYGKGVLTTEVLRSLIATARRLGKPTIVDPKRIDVTAYAGADFITPNRTELAAATGLPCQTDAEAERAAAAMIERTGSAVILTRSAQGMSYFSSGHAPLHLPTFARAVYDVSGAGDTVVATLALGTAAKLPIGDAMRLANHAAGLVVAKLGTATVSPEELAEAIALDAHPTTLEKGALTNLDHASALREQWRRQGLKVGFTNGCFDLLHPGHVSLLKQAAEASDRVIVALNSDASVRRLKGPSRPIQDEQSRAQVIGALAAVDLVILFDDDTPLRLIETLLPDVLVKGADYALDAVVGAREVIAAGGRVMLADLAPGQSTSKLVAAMRTDTSSQVL
jgi:D-beta-D-heptose 7-phosphate kinase/D-beta-D-heptose 1-phosphate adenosyltransferase